MESSILLVEDEVILAMDVKSRLENMGYRICGMATSGPEAVAKAMALQPDLILMDIKIRGEMDGIEATEKIHERMDVPVIFLTAYADEATLKRAKVTEPHGYILKPFEERELAISIEMALYKYQAEKALRNSEERYMLALQGSNDGIWDWDLKKDRVYFSPRWKEMLGYKDAEVGDTPDSWFALIHPGDVGQFKLQISSHLNGLEQFIEVEHRMRTSQGEYLWVLTRGIAILDENGNPHRMSGSQADISRRKRAEERLVYNALHDSLTGLPNRELLLERLSRAIERQKRYRETFALLFIDLDRFKIVNDSLGHTIGDDLLIAVARRLEHEIHSFDTVARLGGDEFIILAENIASAADAELIAERVEKSIILPFQIQEHTVIISASIGIVYSEHEYISAIDALRDADIAMYKAKAKGKARAELFDPNMRTWMSDTLMIENQLRGALERNEFSLEYQPIYQLEGNKIVGFEALLRWKPEGLPKIPPSKFVPIAEETGLICQIGEWVLRKSCYQIKKWQEDHPNCPQLFMSVNLSGRQVNAPDLIDIVRCVLDETGLDPKYLQLEITENLLMENSEVAIKKLNQLAQMGIRIALDDFGTGYSSLSYLQHFPIRTIKIDRSFIQKLDESKNSDEIVRMIVKMAKELGLTTVAEGVETEFQKKHLENVSCPLVQGYLYSPALEPGSAEKLIIGQMR